MAVINAAAVAVNVNFAAVAGKEFICLAVKFIITLTVGDKNACFIVVIVIKVNSGFPAYNVAS